MNSLTNYAIVFITLIGLAVTASMAEPEPEPYDPWMNTYERVDIEENVTSEQQNCWDMLKMSQVESNFTNSTKNNMPCVVICGTQSESSMDRCKVPFTILSSINSDTVANYTINDKLLANQIIRYADFVTRSLDLNEYEITYAVFTHTLMQISNHITQMRDIIQSVEHYLADVERDTECSRLLDIWLGYKVLKMSGIL
jgi:hypothetical protein